MVSFDHRDEGTTNAVWLDARNWVDVPELDVTEFDRLVVVAAHPDDESLGAGGLIATAHAAGIPVAVIVASGGEHSHPESPTHTAALLSAVRRVEVVQAVDELAPDASVTMLGLPDGALKHHVDALQRAIESAVAGSAAALVSAPWRGDGHPDHTAAGQAAAVAVTASRATLVEYPIWGWHWAGPTSPEWPWEQLHRLPLDGAATSRKAAALSRHSSQTEPLSDAPGDEPILSPAFSEHFLRDFESFFVAEPEPEPAAEAPAAAAAAPSPQSLARDYFDTFYEGRTDPWGFETRWYEERKRALTIASLPRRRFSSTLELGCSIGVLSAELAARSDRLLGIDIADAPLETARHRLAEFPGARFERRSLPEEWPNGAYDLVVVSEVGYYLSHEQLAELVRACVSSLARDGIVVACHWRHPVADYPLSGDEVHETFDREPGLVRIGGYSDDDFVLDVFGEPGARSVAAVEGLA